MRCRVFRERANSGWSGVGLPWAFVCSCGRRGHHFSWDRAMSHANQHDCSPGSLW